jgi:hypothetical protein
MLFGYLLLYLLIYLLVLFSSLITIESDNAYF